MRELIGALRETSADPKTPGRIVGECHTTRWSDGSLTVERADPRIHIHAEILEEIASGRYHPSVTLAGDVLTIDATNQRVIYRIAEYDLPSDIYLAEWPD